MQKFLSFDLEIKTAIPEGTDDWWQYAPFGVTSASAWASDQVSPVLWCGHGSDGGIAPQMSKEEIQKMILFLKNAVADGYKLVAFNGAGFDIRVLYEESKDHASCVALAWDCIDPFFHIFSMLGYGPGLSKVAEGMGCGSKTENVDGARAPELWANGQYGKVLEYVANDARLTLDVALAV